MHDAAKGDFHRIETVNPAGNMKTCRQFIAKEKGLVGPTGTLALALLASALALPAGAPKPSSQGRALSPFLEEFRANLQPRVVTRDVTFDTAVGRVGGYLARPDTREALPAVLLIPDEQGLTAWMKENARDLCGIGYVVLAPDLPGGRLRLAEKTAGASAALADEKTLARLSAAVRWLRRRPDVLPGRVGVAGWARGGDQALALAATTPLQGCVVCDALVTDDPALAAGLRGTPVLGVFAGKENGIPKAVAAFRKVLADARAPAKVCVYEGVRAGFMGPPGRDVYVREVADKAWFEIYEFLGKYVEDAPQHDPWARPVGGSLATVADIMRAVNQPTGVRGSLTRLLEQQPTKQHQWDRVRANAALIAEAGHWLQTRTPPRGSHGDWVAQGALFAADAEAIVSAADRQDYPAARRGLQQLATRCAACHKRHR